MKRILVPLDGSALAERALPCAAMLAQGLRAELILLRAVWLPSDIRARLGLSDPRADAVLEGLQDQAEIYLGQVARRLMASEDREWSVRHAVRHGPAAEVIVDYAVEIDARLIAMATHGYGGVSRWRHGSVAERVLQSADVPVLMICAEPTKEVASCQRILVPLDGSPVAEQVIPAASVVARAMDAHVILFQVAIAQASGAMMGDWFVPIEGVFETAHQDAEAYLSRMTSGLRASGIKASIAVQMGGVADAIIDYAGANHIDLIAMCTHGRTGLTRWTLGSVADRVLRARCTPLLLVRTRSVSS